MKIAQFFQYMAELMPFLESLHSLRIFQDVPYPTQPSCILVYREEMISSWPKKQWRTGYLPDYCNLDNFHSLIAQSGSQKCSDVHQNRNHISPWNIFWIYDWFHKSKRHLSKRSRCMNGLLDKGYDMSEYSSSISLFLILNLGNLDANIGFDAHRWSSKTLLS